MVQAAQRDSAFRSSDSVCRAAAACATEAPHLAGALAANAAREGAEVKGAVNAANGHRRRHGLPWLTFVEIDIRESQRAGCVCAQGILSPQVSARAAVSDAGRIRRRLTPQCRAWCGGEPAGAPRPCCARAGWAQPPGRSPRRKQEQQRPEGAAWTGEHAAQRAMLTIEGVGERLSLATGQGYRGRGSTFMIAAKANLVEQMVGCKEREDGKRGGGDPFFSPFPFLFPPPLLPPPPPLSLSFFAFLLFFWHKGKIPPAPPV
jgi:hypothetical protein